MTGDLSGIKDALSRGANVRARDLIGLLNLLYNRL